MGVLLLVIMLMRMVTKERLICMFKFSDVMERLAIDVEQLFKRFVLQAEEHIFVQNVSARHDDMFRRM